jgi:hypothetical protein
VYAARIRYTEGCADGIYTAEKKRERKKFTPFYVYIKEARTTKISNPGYKQTTESDEYACVCFEVTFTIVNHLGR